MQIGEVGYPERRPRNVWPSQGTVAVDNALERGGKRVSMLRYGNRHRMLTDLRYTKGTSSELEQSMQEARSFSTRS